MIRMGYCYRAVCVLALVSALGCGAFVHAECMVERQAVLPIGFDGFMPTIEAVINGQSVALGIDTGAEGMVLFPEAVKALALPRDSGHFATAIGRGSRTLVSNAIIDELEFAGRSYRQKSVPVIAFERPASGAVDHAMVGLIGADLLSSYDVEFDIPARRLTLYHVADCAQVMPNWAGAYMTVAAKLTGAHRLVIPIEIDGVSVKGLFDTGASASVLALASGRRFGVTAGDSAYPPPGGAFAINAAPGTVPIHQFDRIRIGEETFGGMRVEVMDFPVIEADLLIGEDYMRGRRFWLSYATETLFIQAVGTEH
jgi:predicted aspartyl protease